MFSRTLTGALSPESSLGSLVWKKIFVATFASTALIGFLLYALLPSDSVKKIQIFWRLLFQYDIPAVWLSLIIIGIAALSARWLKASNLNLSLLIERRITLISLGSFVLYAGLAYFAYLRHPLAMDEYTVLLQSQIFAAGSITGAVPPELIDFAVPKSFQGYFIQVSQEQGALLSAYWPGFALLLTPFSYLGVPWLCNPVLTAISVWLLHRLALRLTNSTHVAAWATCLFIASPVIAINAASFYSMPAHLLANLLFCYLIASTRKLPLFLAGLVGSFALSLHNPVPHALVAIPFVLWIMRYRTRSLWALLLGYLLMVPFLGVGWSSFLNTFDVGDFATLVNNPQTQPSNNPFFDVLTRVKTAFALPSPMIWSARLAGMFKLVLWAVPGLVVLAYFGCRKQGLETEQDSQPTSLPVLRLLQYSFVLTFVGYLFVNFDQGHGWGFRYLHQVWFALPLWAAVVLARTPADTKFWNIPVKPFYISLIALSLLLLLPQRALQVHNFIDEHLHQIPEPAAAEQQIIFIRSKGGYYRIDLIQNDPYLRNKVWRFASLGASKNAQLAKKWLKNPRRISQGTWGEHWVGEGLTQIPYEVWKAKQS